MSLPDLLPLPAIYRWLRDEVPGGWLAAPVLTWMGIIAALTWAAGFIWNGLGSPLWALMRGTTPTAPIGAMVVAGVLIVIFFGALAFLTVQVDRLVTRAHAGGQVMAALAHHANTEPPRLDARIDDLTYRIEQLEERPAGLQRITQPGDPAPMEGLQKAILDAGRTASQSKT